METSRPARLDFPSNGKNKNLHRSCPDPANPSATLLFPELDETQLQVAGQAGYQNSSIEGRYQPGEPIRIGALQLAGVNHPQPVCSSACPIRLRHELAHQVAR